MKTYYQFVKRVKLSYLYLRRIVFARNNFKLSLLNKIRMNLNGYLADQYVLYELDKNNRELYLSEMDWHKSRFINHPFEFILNNKVVCSQLLANYVLVPEIYAVKKKNKISGLYNKQLSYNDTIELLKKREQIYFKPFLGGKGNDVHYIEYKDEKFWLNYQLISENDLIKLLSLKSNWIISQAMKQHDYAKNLYAETVNTIRMLTIRDLKSNQMKINFAVQRVGVKESIPVDNGSRGGLVAKIDLESGELSYSRSLCSMQIYREHPDSGQKIEGVVIPNWQEIKAVVLGLSSKFTYLEMIAWDVLLTESGEVCIIEANNSSGVNILQLWGGLKKEELGEFLDFHQNN